jgi:BirA family biotin operon repressor/biotin-[acetyl-CoA-carboxylase] ligase
MAETQRTSARAVLGDATVETVGPDLVVVVPVAVPVERQAWLTLVASLALADGLRDVARVPAEVAWPDAVTLQRAMCGGAGGAYRAAEVEAEDGAVVARLSLTASALDLPAGWTSVWAEGGKADAEPIAAAYLAALGARLEQLLDDDPRLLADYRARCVTFGRLVEVDGVQGVVTGLAADASLVATVDGQPRPLTPAQGPRV